MDREDINTVLMPQQVLSRLVTRSKRAHPRLRTRDEQLHADDFVSEEAPSIIEPPLMSRTRAERLAVIALAAAVTLGAVALVSPF